MPRNIGSCSEDGRLLQVPVAAHENKIGVQATTVYPVSSHPLSSPVFYSNVNEYSFQLS